MIASAELYVLVVVVTSTDEPSEYLVRTSVLVDAATSVCPWAALSKSKVRVLVIVPVG